MAYNYPKIAQNAGGTFGPTSPGHYYFPASYHNRTAAHRAEKCKWCLRKNEQYEVFRLADDNHWEDNNPDGLYSVIDNGREVLGLLGERVAFFRNTQNATDSWHGYPVCNPPISASVVPGGCVLEFFDSVVIVQGGEVLDLEQESVYGVRTYMNSLRYRNLISITKKNSLTVHSVDPFGTYNYDRQNGAFGYVGNNHYEFKTNSIDDLPF